MPKISVILVSYNGFSWLEKSLESFANLTDRESIEAIVVDNGSEDRSALRQLQKRFLWATWIENEKNVGFAAGNNIGMQKAKGQNIMLLNSDAEFPPNTGLTQLLANFDHDPSVAVVTPKVVLTSGEIDHASHRGFPTFWNAAMYYGGLQKRFPRARFFAGYTQGWKDMSKRHEVDACSGAAMLVRKSAIDEVGMLDESFFMYAEDIDWCFRFKKHGWKVLYDPAVTVIHHKHKSGLGGAQVDWETRERTVSAFYDTMKQFIEKHDTHSPRFLRGMAFLMIDFLKSRKLQRERKLYART